MELNKVELKRLSYASASDEIFSNTEFLSINNELVSLYSDLNRSTVMTRGQRESVYGKLIDYFNMKKDSIEEHYYHLTPSSLLMVLHAEQGRTANLYSQSIGTGIIEVKVLLCFLIQNILCFVLTRSWWQGDLYGENIIGWFVGLVILLLGMDTQQHKWSWDTGDIIIYDASDHVARVMNLWVNNILSYLTYLITPFILSQLSGIDLVLNSTAILVIVELDDLFAGANESDIENFLLLSHLKRLNIKSKGESVHVKFLYNLLKMPIGLVYHFVRLFHYLKYLSNKL